MRSSRLAAVALLLGGVFLAFAPPAVADTPSGSWTFPEPHGNLEGVPVATLETEAPLTGFAEFDGGIAGVAFTLVQDAAEPDEPCSAAEGVRPQVAPGGEQRVEFSFEASFPCNRRYQVRARVEPQERQLRDDSALVLNLWVDVAIPPPRPEGVTAEIVDRDVIVRWEPVASTPDLLGYEVRRAVGTGSYKVLAEVGSEEWSFTDAGLPDEGATVSYRVRAMRSGPDGAVLYGEPGESGPSEMPARPTDDDGNEGPGSGGGNGGPGPGGDSGAPRSGGGSGGTTTRRIHRAPPVTRRISPPTTLDTGFQEALPFQPRPVEPAVGPVEPAGDPAVIVRLDDELDDDNGQRQTLLLIAGGTTAFSWAVLLRFLNRKAMVL